MKASDTSVPRFLVFLLRRAEIEVERGEEEEGVDDGWRQRMKKKIDTSRERERERERARERERQRPTQRGRERARAAAAASPRKNKRTAKKKKKKVFFNKSVPLTMNLGVFNSFFFWVVSYWSAAAGYCKFNLTKSILCLEFPLLASFSSIL